MKSLALAGIVLFSGCFTIATAIGCGGLAHSTSDEANGNGATGTGLVPPNGTTGMTGPAPSGSGTGSGPGMPAAESNCSLSVDGASVTDAPAISTGSAMLYGTRLTIVCSYRVGDTGWGSLSINMDNVTGAGTYRGVEAYLEQANGSAPVGFTSDDPQSMTDAGCNVVIDAFAPAAKAGMTAHFSCPRLTGNEATVSAEGTLALAPRAGNDAGAPPSLSMSGALNEAGAPSCTINAHGAYEATTAGQGNNYECTTYAADGTRFDFSPGYDSPGNAYVSIGQSWCVGCTIDYEGTCAINVEVDEGIGGRYVASFTCTSLAGGDGTKESIDGRIDGLHVRPPE